MLELVVLLLCKVAVNFPRLLLRYGVVFRGGWISGEMDAGFYLIISGFG